MKKTAVLAAFLLVVCAGAALAENGDLGVGVILGEPSGLSLKFKTSEKTAFDAGVAWSFVSPGSFHVHGDLLFHNYNLFPVEKGRVGLYYGIGARLKLSDETRVGIRIPIGLCYEFADAPLDFFFEIVPLLDLTPETSGGIAGAIGVRYFF